MLTYEDIIRRLCEAGHEAYIVGGCIRDLMSGYWLKDIDDIDICTSASCEAICNLFNDCSVSDVSGTTFRVVLVNGYQIAQYRKDINNGPIKKFHKTVSASTLIEDLERRDLTINSMAMCYFTGEIIDPFNGRNDLINKKICFTGNPVERILQDAERIIRAHRFLAKLGRDAYFEQESLLALVDNIDRVSLIPGDRHQLEIIKAMKLEQPSIFFEALHMTGALEYIFPSLEKCVAHYHGTHHSEDIFEHCMIVGDSIDSHDPILKLAGYLHDIGKPAVWNGTNFVDHEKVGADIAEKELKLLKFSNDDIYRICNLIYCHMRTIRGASPKAVRRVIKTLKERNVLYSDWLEIKIADRAGNLTKDNYTFKEVCQSIDKFDKQLYNEYDDNIQSAFLITDLQITGNDVINILKVKPGKIIGDTLKYLLELVLDDPELNEYNILISIVEEIRDGKRQIS